MLSASFQRACWTTRELPHASGRRSDVRAAGLQFQREQPAQRALHLDQGQMAHEGKYPRRHLVAYAGQRPDIHFTMGAQAEPGLVVEL